MKKNLIKATLAGCLLLESSRAWAICDGRFVTQADTAAVDNLLKSNVAASNPSSVQSNLTRLAFMSSVASGSNIRETCKQKGFEVGGMALIGSGTPCDLTTLANAAQRMPGWRDYERVICQSTAPSTDRDLDRYLENRVFTLPDHCETTFECNNLLRDPSASKNAKQELKLNDSKSYFLTFLIVLK